MGAIEQNLAKQAIAQGLPIPERIANAPELMFGLEMYLDAFFELDSERSHAMGLTAIPSSAIRQYAREYKLDEEQTAMMLYYIRQMDAANLERLNKAKGSQ